MRIGWVQMEAAGRGYYGDSDFYERFAAKAAAYGCTTLLFPELSDTGYALSSLPENARTWPGPALEAVMRSARRNGINMIAGLSEREGNFIYNSAAVVDREGSLIDRYRKSHLFSGGDGTEHRVFTAGDTLKTVMLDGICWGLSICFDLRFPEVFRHLALHGAHIIVNLAAWPRQRIGDWTHFCHARTLENQLFLVAVNQWGALDDDDFGGGSCLIAPDGALLVDSGTDRSGLWTGEVDVARIQAVRHILPVFDQRRPGLYVVGM